MALSECVGCERAETCTAVAVFNTIWDDTGEQVTDKQVATALAEAGVSRAENCEALGKVEEYERGVTVKVQAFMDKVSA